MNKELDGTKEVYRIKRKVDKVGVDIRRVHLMYGVL